MNNSELTDYLQKLFQNNLNDFLCAGPEPTSIHINTLKTSVKNLKKRLSELCVNYSPVKFNSSGLVIHGDHLPLSHTLEFFLGMFFYQGISSQIPALVLDPQPGEKVLDISAAPGSKTAQMGMLMKNSGQLIANDAFWTRMQPLNVNTQRTGLVNHCLYNLPGERMGSLLRGYFDKVLIDAPCTALGTLNTHEEIWRWWSIEKLAKLARIQKQLLISSIKCLKVGGELVYSTCSVTPEENEKLIAEVTKSYPVEPIQLETRWSGLFDKGILISAGERDKEIASASIRIYPHKHRQEGFYIIKLRKTSTIKREAVRIPITYLETHPGSSEIIEPILSSISERYGIPESIWQNFMFYLTKARLWMFHKDMPIIMKEGFLNGGILLAERRKPFWKLTNQSVQFLTGSISKRKITISDNQLKKLFLEGKTNISGIENGYYALEREEKMMASLYIENNVCMIRLPHRFRLIV